MSKRGLPGNLTMRHDWHYVEELSKAQRSIGRVLPVAKIEPNPLQPRVEIGDLTELAASIREKGVLEPLLVKPLRAADNQQKWLIVAGERRWRAAQLAGLTELPCVELDLDDAQIAEIALIENLQRKDLNVWEEADGLASLSKRFGYTHEDIAQKIGRSRTSITESLTIANLPAEIREKCAAAKIRTKSAILQIARQFDDAAMLEAIHKIERANQNRAAAETSSDNANAPDNTADKTGEKSANSNSSSDSPINRETFSAARAPQIVLKTNLQHPVRVYNYQPPEGQFKLNLKFKKPAEKQTIIGILRDLLEELERES